MSANDLKIRMEKLNNIILAAEISALNGAKADIKGLEHEAAIICEQAVKLAPAEAVDIRALMATMINNLEKLAVALSNYRDSFKK